MSLSVRPLLSTLVLLGALLPAAAQNTRLPNAIPQADRITSRASLRATTRLAGHLPSWAIAANDAGPLSPDTTLRLTFVLSRSPERQAAFTQLLADQQNPASSSYHRWLTPQQIGTLYGPTQHDLDTLTGWLATAGLNLKELAPSHVFVTVEAPVSTVANALGTSFRNFSLRDATGRATPHIAATANPAIPTALAAIVTSITGLADSPITPDHHLITPSSVASPSPDLTNGNGSHNIVPADFAVIYNLNPVYQSGINGTGQKIAVLGRSQVLPADITALETLTGIPNKLPNTIIPPAGVDPGMTGTNPTSGTNPGDQGEATVDVGRVIATAPGAQVDLVVSGAVGGLDGLYIAATYAVQTLNDPVINISFSSCEANSTLTTAGVSGFWNTLFEQAAGQGISVIVSSGDSAAAECQPAGQAATGTQVRSINTLCASSYATCVGGTEFADFTSPSTYWKTTNSTNPITNATYESAISYIPEGAWNEPGTASPFLVNGTGGGASIYIPKPSWQTGAGVPADNFRDIPDVSFASSSHDSYLVCLAYGGATCTTSGGNISNVGGVAGTSVAAPAMAAIAALLNQKSGGSQGNLNPLLYDLATNAPAVFHDATPATSGVASCDINTPSMCNNSTPSSAALTGGLAGYPLTAGYDLATGLGSLDVAAFLNTYARVASISVSAASPSLTLQRGDTTSNTDVLTLGSFAYAGNASLACTVTYTGATPAASSPICNIAPSTVALTGGGTATTTLTLATSTPVSAALAPLTPPASREVPVSRLAFASLFLLALLPAKRYSRSLRAWRSLPVYLLLLAGLGALSACSGSSTPVSPNPLLVSPSNPVITVSAPTIFAGATDTLSATVYNIGFNTLVTPTGTVKFFQDGSTLLATTALVNGVANAGPIPFNNSGNFLITASYSGDGSFSSSNATGVPIAVIPRGTTLGNYTVTVTATTPSGLTASTNIAVTVQ
jgi:pseudomonalisin